MRKIDTLALQCPNRKSQLRAPALHIQLADAENQNIWLPFSPVICTCDFTRLLEMTYVSIFIIRSRKIQKTCSFRTDFKSQDKSTEKFASTPDLKTTGKRQPSLKTTETIIQDVLSRYAESAHDNRYQACADSRTAETAESNRQPKNGLKMN